MNDSISNIFSMSLKELELSDFRFYINRSRSVVIMTGNEFDNKVVPNNSDIYILYNDPDRSPVLISITSSEDKIEPYTHDGYKISYVSTDFKRITYLREDALTILDKPDLQAVEGYN